MNNNHENLQDMEWQLWARLQVLACARELGYPCWSLEQATRKNMHAVINARITCAHEDTANESAA